MLTNRSRSSFAMYLLVCFFVMVNCSFAADKKNEKEKVKSPLNIPGTTKVTAENLIEILESNPKLVIIDSRIIGDRQQGFIEDSISLPDEETTCASIAQIVPKINHPTVYYCNGPKCGRSANAVKIALKCGYSNIYWFRGGFEEWKFKNFPVVK